MSDSTRIIVSYDGTHNEDDAVALGRVFAQLGAEVSLAYVRHTPDALAESEAEELLRRGAALMGGHEAGRHVVTDRSTPEGLRKLADSVGADAIVFCSDSHTAKGHIAIGNSARRLIEGGPLAIAIAPAGYAAASDNGLVNIAVDGREEQSAFATAESLAAVAGASVSSTIEGADLLVIGSRHEAGAGHVALSAASEKVIEDAARCPVLVLARGKQLAFAGGSFSSAPLGGVPVAA